MPLDYATLDSLRARHPAWRLLRSDHAPLIAAFLERVFVLPNRRVIPAAELTEALEDELYALRQSLGAEAFPKAAAAYLDDWAASDKGWLRKYYRAGTDEAQYDLTPATEKAIAWLAALTDRPFVGTESRLLTLYALVEQIVACTETDPEARLAELSRRRAEIDAEIARVAGGDVPLLDDTAIRDRFQQFQQLARELLADFREVEHNFRQLDRSVRERIALWEGSKGELLDEILGERDAIADSDQGRSFRAFWDFLMSSRRQEALSERLDRIVGLPALGALKPDPRIRRVHYDWLEAGEHAQRTVAQLSEQLRRFLDDRAWLENRRIMDLLRGIEAKALALRESPPTGPVTTLEAMGADIELPLERPLFTPAPVARLKSEAIEAGEADLDSEALYRQIVIDKAQLAAQVRTALRRRPQLSLRELLAEQPLEHGLAELLAYLEMAHAGDADAAGFRIVVDERFEEPVSWSATAADGTAVTRTARMPRLIFTH